MREKKKIIPKLSGDGKDKAKRVKIKKGKGGDGKRTLDLGITYTISNNGVRWPLAYYEMD